MAEFLAIQVIVDASKVAKTPKIIRQVARGAGELTKLLVKPPNELDEEAEMQRKSSQRVPVKLCEERGNYEK